jgi:hypothetical protein
MSTEDGNISRESLYEQVWREPISTLASSYHVSGSYLARICRELNVPTPGRGYWAQVSAGKKPQKEALPNYRVGDPTMWIRSSTSSRHTDVMPIPPAARSEIPPMRRSHGLFGFLSESKEILLKARKADSSDYLKPRINRVVDVLTKPEHLDDAIGLASKFFSRLEDYGYRVVIASKEQDFRPCTVETEEIIVKRPNNLYYYPPWRPVLCTVAYLGTVAIGISIVEMTEKQKATGYYSYETSVASGRFRIYGYSPYLRTDLVKYWQDTKELRLLKRFDEIIAEFEKMANLIPSLILEGEKKAEEERIRQEAERLERHRKREIELRAQANEESRTDLDRIIKEWGELKSRQAFIEELSHAIRDENPETRTALMERLEVAKTMLKTESAIDIIKSWKTPDERFANYSSWLW